MSTIANITVALSADISGFKAGMKGATGSLREVLKALADQQRAAMTPLQLYDQALQRSTEYFNQGRLSITEYLQTVRLLNDERTRAVAAINTQAKAEKDLAAAMAVAKARMDAAQGVASGRLTVKGQNAFQATDLKQLGAHMVSENLTAMEKYAAQVALVDQLLKRKKITDEIANRELARQKHLLDDATGATARLAAAEAAAASRRERHDSLAARAQMNAGANVNDLARQAMTPAARATDDYNAAIRRLDRDLRRTHITQDQYNASVRNARAIMQQAIDPAKGMGNGLRYVLSAIHPSIGQMAAFGVATGGSIVAITALKDAMSFAVNTGFRLMVQFEQVEVSLTTMYHSATKGKQVLEEMKQIAALTPMEFPEIAQSGKQLAAAGIAANDLAGHLRLLTELAAGSGSSIEELTRVYTRNMLQGRQYTRDINEFSNNAIPIWDQLAKTMNRSKEEVHKMVTDGQVGFREIMVALNELVDTGGRWHGASEAMQKSTKGLWSTTKDYFSFILADMSEAVSKAVNLKGVLEDINKTMSESRDLFVVHHVDTMFGQHLTTSDSLKKVIKLQAMLQDQRREYADASVRDNKREMQESSFQIERIKTMIKVHQNLLTVKEAIAYLDTVPHAKPGDLPTPVEGGRGADQEARERQVKSLDEIIEKLRKESIEVEYGKEVAARMAAEELAFATNTTEAAVAIMAEYDAIVEDNRVKKEMHDADKKAVDDAKRLSESYEKLIARLRVQTAAIEQNADAQRMAQLALDGYNNEQIRGIMLEERKHSLAKKTADQQKRIADERKRESEALKSEAKTLKESLETPEATAERKGKRIKDMFFKGFITKEERDAALKKLDIEMNQANTKNQKKGFGSVHDVKVAAAEFGSKEAYSIMVRSLQGGGTKNTANQLRKQQLENMRQQLVINRQQLAEMRKPKRVANLVAGAGAF